MCQIFHFLVVRSFICLSFSSTIYSTRNIRGISEEESSGWLNVLFIFTDPSHHDPSSCPLVLPGHLRDHRRFQRRAEVGPQGPRRCECAGFALRGANYVSVKAAGGDEISSIHIDPTDSTLTSTHLTAPLPLSLSLSLSPSSCLPTLNPPRPKQLPGSSAS